VYMILIGIGISLLLNALVPHDMDYPGHNRYYDMLLSIFIAILVWEGNLRIDSWMNTRFPWVNKPGKRILIHLPVGIVFSVMAIYLPALAYNIFVCPLPEERKATLMITSITIGVLITIIILSIEIGSQFFAQWKNSLIEIEKYKAETLQAQLQNLKNQINPHFLFNNLSVLSSLVYKDPDKAVDFINQLSKVYRYLLDNRNSELVRLDEELEFIRSYISLIQIRFGENIGFKIEVPEEQLLKLVPPMALQVLIENVIKHNEISAEHPLTIYLKSADGSITVSNNLQVRLTAEPSSKTGLQNITDRYKFFTDKLVEVIQTKESFTVKIPLLETK